MKNIKYGLVLLVCCAGVPNAQAFFGLFPVPVPAPVVFEGLEPIPAPVLVAPSCFVEHTVCCEPVEEPCVEVKHVHTFHPVHHRRHHTRRWRPSPQIVHHRRHRMRRWRPRPQFGFGFGFGCHRPQPHVSFNFGF